jgi:chemotaxis response regulator CheB
MLADKTGWKLSEAENGKVAVDLTKQSPPDVMLLDVVMPVMNGIKLPTKSRRLRRIPKLSSSVPTTRSSKLRA